MKAPIYILFLFIFLIKIPFSHAQIVNIEDKRVRLGDSITFKGFVDMGFNLYKNDKYLTSARTALQLEKAYKNNFFLFLGGFNFVKAEGQNFLNDGFTHLRYNADISKNWVFEAFTQAQYNERTRLKFRGLMGSGVRFKLRLAKNQRIYLGTALMYENDQFNDATPRQNDYRFSTYLSHNLQLPNKSRLVHTTYYQPLVNNFNKKRISSEASLIVSISSHLSFKATANLSYDNDPRLPSSVPDLIYSWTNGLRWDF